MTLGEKIKAARKSSGMTQEQLAEKLTVSRQAITKWESDKGIPDIDNLKRISKLLNVSIDYLLDDGEQMDKAIIREAIDLTKYGKGRKKAKKDRIIREKYPESEIYTLMAKQGLTKGEKVIDNAVGFLTDAPFGIPELINGIKMIGREYYLVTKADKQFLVVITDEFMESRELTKHIETGKNSKFESGDLIFTICTKL